MNGASSDKEESEETIETSEETPSFELSNVLLPSQLKGKVEVINAEKSVGSYGYPSMEITFKLLVSTQFWAYHHFKALFQCL